MNIQSFLVFANFNNLNRSYVMLDLPRLMLTVIVTFGTFSISARADDKLSRRNVAVFIHEGVELLDFAGPGEVFAAADKGKAFKVYTVAASKDPITSQRFLKITPEYNFEDCPKPDLIVVPGGNTALPLKDPKVVAWIKKASGESEITLSVCTGAFLVAKAGLLDGKEATTHWGAIESFKKSFPGITVRENRRFVDNGKVITSAGVSAGIDGSLHVVKRLLGEQAAKETARYMEYRWEPEATAGKNSTP